MLDDFLQKQSFSTKRLESKIHRASSMFFLDLEKKSTFDEIISVNKIDISRGKYLVRIWVSFSKYKKENRKLYEDFLDSASKPLRKYLASKISSYKIPPLKLIVDDTFEYLKQLDQH